MKNKNKTKKVKENNSVVVETVEFKAKEKKNNCDYHHNTIKALHLQKL